MFVKIIKHIQSLLIKRERLKILFGKFELRSCDSSRDCSVGEDCWLIICVSVKYYQNDLNYLNLYLHISN